MKRLNKKGFTMAELLIVVAIIAVLVAIAIPVFSAQLEKARDATDEANVRAAIAEATVEYLDDSTVSMPITKTVAGKGTDAKWAQTDSATMNIGGYDVTAKAGFTSVEVTIDTTGIKKVELK